MEPTAMNPNATAATALLKFISAALALVEHLRTEKTYKDSLWDAYQSALEESGEASRLLDDVTRHEHILIRRTLLDAVTRAVRLG